MRIIERPLLGEADFWRIRALLVDSYPLAPPGLNWEVRNWEGKWLYAETPGWDPAWEAAGRVWETTDGRLLGAIHPGSLGFAFLEVDPAFRGRLETEMIERAEETIAVAGPDGEGRQLRFYLFEHDEGRRHRLAARGYRQTAATGVTRRLYFGNGALLARQELAAGYTLRTVQPGDEADAARVGDLLNAAFNRDFHNAAEYLTFARLAPSYHPELELAAVAPDGSFAAYVGIPYVEPIGHGLFEPVCTHPAHQRQGLARTLMVEGLHRLQALGARDVVVETGDMIPANRLYDSLGFSERYVGHVWERAWEPAEGVSDATR